MKRLFLFVLFVITVTPLFSQVLNSPESVVFDSMNKRYLISNAANTKTGGSIVSLDPLTHEISSFVSSGVNSPKGLCIVNEIVYCTDVTSVVGFSLINGEEIFRVDVPGSGFLNDITSDNVNLFVSDNSTHSIYKISIVANSVEVLCTGGNLNSPNGLYYDEKMNRILICSYREGSTIQSYDLKLNRLIKLSSVTLDYLDGITLDSEGNCYVSSWATDAVYKFSPDFQTNPEEVSNGHYGPADIFYSSKKNTLAIPNFRSNVVDFLDIGERSIEEEMNPYLISIFPNPAKDEFYISCFLEKPERIEIYFMNKSGRILSEKKFTEKKVASQHFTFESKSLGLREGVFFIKMVIGECIFMKRIAILE